MFAIWSLVYEYAMKSAIICYDLKNVKPHDNILVKAELAKFSNTFTETVVDNLLSKFPDWVKLSFPDTTIIATVPDTFTASALMEDVLRVITSVGAEADRVYIAFIDPENDFIFNAVKEEFIID